MCFNVLSRLFSVYSQVWLSSVSALLFEADTLSVCFGVKEFMLRILALGRAVCSFARKASAPLYSVCIRVNRPPCARSKSLIFV
ncbi:hypothetical protein GGR07_001585 [Bacteroides pyogenes]|nr:hypothetical protein [Bacteroides pyogenes]SUV30866.1 Uncharacterised protein [Bacteroides pyogenes]